MIKNFTGPKNKKHPSPFLWLLLPFFVISIGHWSSLPQQVDKYSGKPILIQHIDAKPIQLYIKK